MYLAQGHNAVASVKAEIVTSRSRDMHSTTELLHSLHSTLMYKKNEEEGKDQESILTSTKQESQEVSPITAGNHKNSK